MRRAIPLFVLSAILAATSARAQAVCVTPNCVFGDAPAICKNKAAVRTPTVQMTIGFVFVPAEPRIEPGDCVSWVSSGTTHSGTANPCPSSFSCGSPAPAACRFETGNVPSGTSTGCHYDPVTFPAGTGDGYYCRLHATPTSGSMRGTLRVTTPIVLAVQKNTAAGSIELSWTGGGVTGDVSYKVAKQTAGDPKFPAGTTTTLNPTGGVLGTSFTDGGELSSPATRYYLVRNKQTNE